jgi:4-amino-4-deoxy-L-arabinose transferase-like glycosyltransferase
VRRPALQVALATLVAALLRFGTITKQALWMDEYIWTLTATLRSLHDIVFRPDGYPPSVALLVRALMAHGFGSDFWLRFPSAVAGTLSVPLLYLVGRRLAPERTAIVAAYLLALQPFAVWYSQEVGAYALALLLGLASTYCLLRLLEGGETRWGILYGLAAAAGFGVHYYFAFVVLAHGLYGLGVFVRRPERRKVLLVSGVVAGLLLMAWAPLFVGDVLGQREQDKGSAASLFALPYTAQLFAGGFGIGPPLRSMHAAVRAGENPSDLGPRRVALPAFGILVLAALVLMGLGYGWGGRRLLLVLLGFLPFAGPWINSFCGVGYRPRYALSALPFALLLACGGLETKRRRTAATLLVLLAAIEGAGYLLALTPAHVREDTRSAAAWVAEHGGADVVLVGEGAEPYKRYSQAPGRIVDLDLPDTEDEARLKSRLQPLLDGSADVVVVLSRPWTEDPDDKVLALVGGRMRLADSAEFAGVTARRFTRSGP